MVVLFENGGKDAETITIRRAFIAASEKLNDKILFSYSTFNRSSAQMNLGTILGVTEEDMPTLRVVHNGPNEMMKYKFEENLKTASTNSVIAFVESYLKEEL